ncbi:hypothetical protein OSB04_un000256 [Centaurea solstitialis]|uniref:Endoglucanase n=1 Tax=Centaurea solstitialis TaxID=347529 RepID=A0AA38VS30_9ASTR|nr:hypothetical protein OSB04_un000256 [Centaurea solstitialis]
MYGRDPWGGPLEINNADSATDDDRSRNLNDFDRAALSRPLDETQQSWLLGPGEQKKKKYVDLGCIIVSRKIFVWTLGLILAAGFIAGLVTLIVKTVPRHHKHPPPPDNYTIALQKALMFFNAQKCKILRMSHSDPIQFNYIPFVKYNLLLLNMAVGKGDTSGGPSDPNDHSCWMRPEDIDYPRPVTECSSCSDLAAEMAAALASASIVFKDNKEYSKKLVHGAATLWKFARDQRGLYTASGADAATFYNSSMYWDEFVWGGTWMYYATGNQSYLYLASHPKLAKHAGAFWGGPDYGVLSWDNKLTGAQVLLTRLRLFLSPGYPYEETLQTFHNQTSIIMCSYLPYFSSFNRTKGGLIQLNHGRPQPLQYVVNAAFLATLYSDYLDAADTPGWYCGPNFYSTKELRKFAETQINYILGKNPKKMSYLVGYGNHYPKQVHHRGASIPKNRIKYSCTGGIKFRDAKKPNPNTIVGAMVAGPDRRDGFHDVRSNYNYTEPTLAGNAGLVAALVALSGDRTTTKIDKNTIFSAVPPMFPTPPPPPAPWKP